MYNLVKFDNIEGLVFVGDVHGEWQTLAYKVDGQYQLKNYLVIQLGDFGIGFNSEEYNKIELKKLSKRLKKGNNQLVALRGNHDCLSINHRVLTKQGWKKHDEIKMGDFVLSFNIEKKYSEWCEVEAIILRKSEYIYTQQGQSFEIECTEDHRHLLYNNNNIFYKKTKEITSYKDLQSKILLGSIVNNPEMEIKDDEIKLVAWLMTDGCRHRRDSDGYRISQSKEEYIVEIKQILDNIYPNYTEYVRDRSDRVTVIGGKTVKNIKVEWRCDLCVEQTRDVRKRLLEDHKVLPSWVYDLSYRQLKIFTDTLLKADGSFYNDRRKDTCWQLHGEKKILEQFQPLFCMCGYRCTLVEDNRGDYKLNININVYSNVLINGRKFEKKEYGNEVFCLTTKNGNFLTELNGNCHFTGNCPQNFDGVYSKTYSNIHLVPDYTVIEITYENGNPDDGIQSTTSHLNILCIGGGLSVDRTLRREWKWKNPKKNFYWEDEMPVYDNEKLNMICENYLHDIHILATHSNPTFTFPQTKEGIVKWLLKDMQLKDDLDIERGKMDKILEHLKPYQSNLKEWYYSHYHCTKSETIDGIDYRLLDICEFRERRL